jgi:hypothetical protein
MRLSALPALALVIGLSVAVSTTTAETIQYDDGTPEIWYADWGVATRFTVPAEYGPTWELEGISILAQTETADSMNIKIWSDADMVPGAVLFENSFETSSGSSGSWRTFDVSGAGLKFAPGQSFYGGLMHAEPEWEVAWDETHPDHERSLFWTPEGEVEGMWMIWSDDAMIRASGTSTPEPSAAMLLATGAVMLMLCQRGRRK